MLSVCCISITFIFAAVPIQCNVLQSQGSSINLGIPSSPEFELPIEAISAASVLGQSYPVKAQASEPGDDPRKRVNCFPEPVENVTELQRMCVTRGCIFDSETDQSISSAPQCYFPRNTGYALLDQQRSDTTMIYKKGAFQNPYGVDIAFLQFSYSYNGATLCIHIGQSGRFEPPVQFPRLPSVSSESFEVLIANDSDLFSFKVERVSTKTSIWDTSIGAFLFADQYIQIATLLPTDHIYGFGEHAHSSLKHDLSQYTTWGMLARKEEPDYLEKPLKNLYGVHPFYMGLEHNSMAHGVFISNSNAQEITTGPGPHLVYRTIGGNLDIHFFPGPKPEQVVQQYQAFIGSPLLPSYYSLGFQIGRNGYASADELKAIVNNVSSTGILFDVININTNYMNESRDFTLAEVTDEAKQAVVLGNGLHVVYGWILLKNVSQNLHKDGYRITLLFNAAISVTGASFRRALLKNVSFVEWPVEGLVQKDINSLYAETNATKIMLGVGWPNEHVAFPDFFNTTSQTNNWWSDELQLFNSSIYFDGIWLDMNEPSSFRTNEQRPSYNDSTVSGEITPLSCPLSGAFSTYDNPPFKTANAYYYGNKGELSSKTLCMIATTGGGSTTFYNTKNLYGLQHSIATFKALSGSTRQILIARSTFPSSGHYTGHCFGGDSAGWADLRGSIIAAQEFNLFGIPYVGSYICGDNSTLDDVELCVRWYQLGAFYSLSSDNNYKYSPSKDPVYNEAIAIAAKHASIFKYRYRPYLYSLHFNVALNGGTVLKPVFFEFPDDAKTFNIDEQFMWGEAMMVIPVVQQKTVTVSAYLPNARWYSLRDEDYGAEVAAGQITLSAAENENIPVLIRGGHSVPRQVPNPSATAWRTDPFDLLIALDSDSQATGQLYWDDGESIVENFTSHRFYQFSFLFNSTMSKTTLEIFALRRADLRIPSLNIIEIFGSEFEPDFATIKLNDQPTTIDLSKSYWDRSRNLTHIEGVVLLDLQHSQHDVFTWERKSVSPSTTATTISTEATTASLTDISTVASTLGSSTFLTSTSSLTSTSQEPISSTLSSSPTQSSTIGSTEIMQPSWPPTTLSSPSTEEPSTEISPTITVPPVTSPPSTLSSPSTEQPSTETPPSITAPPVTSPSTILSSPSTEEPSTETPPSITAPSVTSPSTILSSPSTEEPSTETPTTVTAPPVTSPSTTLSSPSTEEPSTETPTTVTAPSVTSPSTILSSPSTEEPSTETPTTVTAPSVTSPSTILSSPSTEEPSTETPTTVTAPSVTSPSTTLSSPSAEQSSTEPTITAPPVTSPSTTLSSPSTEGPSTETPTTVTAPSVTSPSTILSSPSTEEPSTETPTTVTAPSVTSPSTTLSSPSTEQSSTEPAITTPPVTSPSTTLSSPSTEEPSTETSPKTTIPSVTSPSTTLSSPSTEQPSTEPTITTPPVTSPSTTLSSPSTEQPSTEPTITAPPVTSPSTTLSSPSTEQPSTEPTITAPPVTSPSTTLSSPSTEEPSTETSPKTTIPPVTSPSTTLSSPSTEEPSTETSPKTTIPSVTSPSTTLSSPSTEQPSTEPTITTPPVTHHLPLSSPSTEQPSTEPTITAPPVTSPSTTLTSPSTEQPSTEPTITAPPVTSSPMTLSSLLTEELSTEISSGYNSTTVPHTTFDTLETTSKSESTIMNISTEASTPPKTSLTPNEEISVGTTSLAETTTSSRSATMSSLSPLTFAVFVNIAALFRGAF